MAAAFPTLFLSHGSPMHALQPGAVRGVWEGIARDLPRPKAILIASAHWETRIPAVTGAAKPETIHDFYGFPKPLYEIQYPATGSPEVAARASELLEKGNFQAAVDPTRGLDHGAWSPLLYMYPEADVPVVQVAIQTELGTRHHIELGRALAPLSKEGVLIIGSGHMTHNLRDRARDESTGGPAPYARAFQDWVRQRIDSHALEEIADYRSLSPDGLRAHPTDEHFLPLFIALGAAPANYKARRLHDGIEMGALAMDAYLFR
ncbi:MAG: dioxygenase [Candidatus Parcubacteria bacterium]|nr:dioxygenase [Burkholderiales bacterium]